MKIDKLAKFLIGAGIALTLWVWLYESSSAFEWDTTKDFVLDAAFEIMLAFPWLVLLALYITNINKLGIVISAVPMLLLELLAYHTTFISPEGSTAALIYAVKPFYQLIIMLIGLLIGYVINRGRKCA